MMRAMASWISSNRSGIFLTMEWPLSRHALGYAPAILVLSRHLLHDRANFADPSEVPQGRRGYAPAQDTLINRYHFSRRLHRARPIQRHVHCMHHACLLYGGCPHVSIVITLLESTSSS